MFLANRPPSDIVVCFALVLLPWLPIDRLVCSYVVYISAWPPSLVSYLSAVDLCMWLSVSTPSEKPSTAGLIYQLVSTPRSPVTYNSYTSGCPRVPTYSATGRFSTWAGRRRRTRALSSNIPRAGTRNSPNNRSRITTNDKTMHTRHYASISAGPHDSLPDTQRALGWGASPVRLRFERNTWMSDCYRTGYPGGDLKECIMTVNG